jgi:hypothetical protein
MVDIVQSSTLEYVYVNATLQSTTTISVADGNTGRGPLFGIGSDIYDSANYISAIFDDFAVFNRVPTQTDLNLLYNGPTSSFTEMFIWNGQ